VSAPSRSPWRTWAAVEHEAVIDSRGRMVADCAIILKGRTQAENVANAALIAKAPELLSAVKGLHVAEQRSGRLRPCDRGDCPLCELIASAEGRS
jgi:hypothetical protein